MTEPIGEVRLAALRAAMVARKNSANVNVAPQTKSTTVLPAEDWRQIVAAPTISNLHKDGELTIIPSKQLEDAFAKGFPIAAIDPRILNTSYSSSLTLHSCPRKYQLYKLSSKTISDESAASTLQQLTFDFGHMVGTGIQGLMMGRSLEDVIFLAFLAWDLDLLVENPKQKKSFWVAIAALQQFDMMRKSGYLQDYDIVFYDGKPAAELSARISFPDGFKYRLHMDLVLVNRHTQEIAVIEVKTSSDYNAEPAKFKNSSQALGYSVILDVIEPKLSSYKVIYLVFLTKKAEWEVMEFPKSYTMRAQWIQELLLDNKQVLMYEETGIYPKHGESCHAWYRDCEYLQTCGLSTSLLSTAYNAEKDPELEKVYDFEFTIEQVVDAQIRKEVR